MKIGVLSDTHDQGNLIEKAVEIFNREQVSWVFHCGDWVSPFILYFFRGLQAPLRGIFGNNDGDKFRHLAFKNRWSLDIEYEERFLSVEIDSRSIAIFHGDYTELVEALVTCGKYDAVFHGHTHQRVNEKVGKTLSLNPGSLMPVTSPTIQGSSIALYDTTNNTAKHVMLE